MLIALALACASLPFAHACAGDAEVADAVQKNLGEFLALLAIPNVADRPADIRRNADFVKRELERRGFTAGLLANPANRPLVFAKLDGAPGTKTILFYIHLDGQPVVPEEWAQPNPFDPVVKRRDANGAWQPVGRDALDAKPLDRELRVFARSASDDKAPILMMLTAIDLLKAGGQKPAFGVEVIVDSEEEMGSPSLAGVVASNKALFRADALVILDGPEHPSGRPTLVFGNRGIAQAKLVVYGPPAPLHSGHFGNYAPNPAFRLAALLAGMKDDDGRVRIAGWYDGIALTAADRAEMAASGDDEAALTKRTGVAKPEKVGATYQESLQYPSLNVRGMASASIGAKAANIVPSDATAELDFRTTPENDGRHLFDLVKRYIESKGYHLVDGAPSDADRAKYDRLASFTLGSVEKAERTPMDSSLGQWAYRAVHSASGPEPVRIRMMGGTVPTDVLVDALHLPFLMIPTVNADNNQHAHDENVRVGNLVSGTETIYALLTTPYP
jgi:acetylornithine deacetylase/succinyl-diaminopimelate desuccinylase-like protein